MRVDPAVVLIRVSFAINEHLSSYRPSVPLLWRKVFAPLLLSCRSSLQIVDIHSDI